VLFPRTGPTRALLPSLLVVLVGCEDKPSDSGRAAPDTSSPAIDSGDRPPCSPEPEVCDGVDNDCNGEVDEADIDGDGFAVCEDCDDQDPFVHPGAAEACDGIDNDCSGAADEPWDEDGDGQSPCGGDCNDRDPAVSGHLPEICDGLDNDCDGVVDEEFDLDGDGSRTCDGDCDDGNPAAWPGNDEVCDGIDNDCDPVTDEDADLDGDGLSICGGDCDDGDESSAPGREEICDRADNDCDGAVDELPECFDCVERDDLLICLAEVTQADAVAACEALGGQLVILETPERSDAVGETVSAVTSARFWIGLTDRDAEGSWIWVDGSPLAYTSRWAPGEPNDSGGEDCVHNNWNAVGYWNDLDCSSTQPFVCEDVPPAGG